MQTDYIIVGQGICGTFLSWELEKLGASCLLIDDNYPATSSRVAAGVINPVTGRRIVRTWMIETLLPFALNAYNELGKVLNIDAIRETPIINLFPTPQMRNAFIERLGEEGEYLELAHDDHVFDPWLDYHFGHGQIRPAYTVQLPVLLTSYRNKLEKENKLITGSFDSGEFVTGTNGVSWNGIKAKAIIFCDGIASATRPFFEKLPFALNKGEALLVKIKELPQNFVYKKAITLVPLGHDYFWAGASHEWDYTDALPTKEFKAKTMRQLQAWLKVPVVLEAELASVRPATLERRPFVGMHPHMPAVGILNGMGTKGCSLAPYFAMQFAKHLVEGSAIQPDAAIQRFNRILQPVS